MKTDWTLIRRIHHGHSYWSRIKDGVIGIADNSGSYPENCEPVDKPPLLLDLARPIVMGNSFLVPVRHEGREDAQLCTPVDAFEAFWAATFFKMDIQIQEKWDRPLTRFSVTEKAVTT